MSHSHVTTNLFHFTSDNDLKLSEILEQDRTDAK